MSETTIYNPGCDCGGAFLSGTVPPIAAQGENGDFYLDFSVYDLYGPKTAGQWPTPPVSLTGPAGVGAQGPAGPAGQQGIPGPKGATGVQGPTGATGATGPAGAPGAPGTPGTRVYGSNVDPISTDGITGDFWLNTATGFLWGPKDATTNWVGTGFSVIGPTGATGPAGAPGQDQPIVDLHVGQQNSTNNSTSIAVTAASDPTLHSPADFIQITGIWDAIPHGYNNGVTQQTNQLTVGRSGVYRIAAWTTYTCSTNNTTVGIRFAVNGVISLSRTPSNRVTVSNDKRQIAAHGIHFFAAGDVITLWVASDTTTNVTFIDTVFSLQECIATGVDLTVEDEGTPVGSTPQVFNFVGAGVTVTQPTPGEFDISIPGGGGGGSLDVEDEGISVDPAVTIMDFVGAGVTVTQTAPGEVSVSIPGGGSGVAVQDETNPVTTASTLNFTGAGVVATDAGGGTVDVTIPGEVHLGDVVSVTATASTNMTVNNTDPANPTVGWDGVSVQDEGSPIVTARTMNFVGAGVTTTDVGGVATVTIPGGGGGSQVGVASSLASGNHYLTNRSSTAWGNSSLSTSVLTFNIMYVDSEITASGLAVHVSSAGAGSSAVVSIYNFLGAGDPGTAIRTATIDTSVTGQRTASFSGGNVTLQPGVYFVTLRATTTNPTLTSGTGSSEASFMDMTLLRSDTFTTNFATTESIAVFVNDAALPGGSWSAGMDLTSLVLTSANSTVTTSLFRTALIKV